MYPSSPHPRARTQAVTPSVVLVPGWAGRTVRNLAAQDWFALGYQCLLLAAVATATFNGRGDGTAVRLVTGNVLATIVGFALTRGHVLSAESNLSRFLYRMVLMGPMLGSYFQLRVISPTVTDRVMDAQILALDQRLFGYEPAIAWDSLVTPQTTEWFAFFYFLYFGLLCVHVLPILFGSRSNFRTAHFALGITMLVGIGHVLYLMVPGFGPYKHLTGQFVNPLEGGRFWHACQMAVSAGGAQRDIFPSLHTAVPTFFTLYSYIHRAERPYKYTWPVMAVISSQIIVATMFLRWHYLIDIFAGLTLAVFSVYVSHRVVVREIARRKAQSLEPAFTPIEIAWPNSRAD